MYGVPERSSRGAERRVPDRREGARCRDQASVAIFERRKRGRPGSAFRCAPDGGVGSSDAAVALWLADLAIQDVECRPPNLAVWVVEGLQHREAGWFVDDRVVQNEQASMADPIGRVVHAPQQRRLGVFATGAERKDRLVF